MEKDLLLKTLSICALISSSAFSEVLIDQIGPNDGSYIGEAVSANQYFEAGLETYNIAVLEYIFLLNQRTLSNAEFVLEGWDGFTDPSSITSYQFNVYSDVDSAGVSLQGDLHSEDIDSANVTISSEWSGNGHLVKVPINAAFGSGEYWFSIIPSNDFDPHGQVGVYESLIGDGITSMQANPGEEFGFGTTRSLGFNTAYRLSDDVIVDPCTLQLPPCPEDISQDGYVSISDLLEIISQWGDCGNGEYRPSADCAPLPNGDCCVSITDILAVVAAWNAECTPHGACCLPSGVCEEGINESNCHLSSGFYFGDDTQCAKVSCTPLACCIDLNTCLDISSYSCEEFGGVVHFTSTCETTDCSLLSEGDECLDAIPTTMVNVAYDTTFMTPSQPEPNDGQCYDSNLEWSNSPDVWYSFIAPNNGYHTFSLCDIDGYDTSLVLYEGNCDEQVACNGDSIYSDTENCQEFYSEILYDVSANTQYYIRIGGWYGETGSGTLTIDVPEPGACCWDDGTCLDNFSIQNCEPLGGSFLGENVLCAESECIATEGDECDDATVVTLGEFYFSTSNSSPSIPEPSDLQCADSYLEWGFSPDIWARWSSPDSGVATFTTCDIDSYDTSIVLYEGNCSNQVACNGDAENDPACQQYYSEIVFTVSANTNYYIRIGGWQGTTGDGTLTITLDGDNDTGACCVQGKCTPDQLENECLALGGEWRFGETCKVANCADIPCNSASFTQTPHAPEDVWFAANSSSDYTYKRAEFVNVPDSTAITVWGLQAHFDGANWSSCDTEFEFAIRSYTDQNGFPGAEVNGQLNVPSTRTATGTLYAGVYELVQWDMDYVDTNIEHISVQAETANLDCWFLWLSSGTGDSKSALNTGTNWTIENFDLSICIE
ncbi:MAG: hypothetical protein HOC27_03415 [Phycisphaerae bacterium]|nr:hypothetical protein [Phycisphaerae bacterium]